MNRFKLLIVVFLGAVFTIHGQNYSTVEGNIIDEKNEPIEFANILLLSKVDSTFIKGTISSNGGLFKIADIKNDNYIIKASFIGYKDAYRNISLNHSTDAVRICLSTSENLLGEVVITSKIAPFKMEGGNIIANVSMSLLNSVGNANDVLQRIPGIIMEDNKINVLGKGNPIVYINNKKLNSYQELESLESLNIATVELITNPGAKYDAEGRAVLIIKTKEKQNGLSVLLSERLTISTRLNDTENISIAYSRDKINFFTTYYHNNQSTRITGTDYYYIKSKDTWEHTIDNPHRYSYYENRITTGSDIELNDKNIIGGQYNFYSMLSNNDLKAKGYTYLNGAPNDEIASKSIVKEKPNQHLVNLFYDGKFNDKFNLHFDFDYLNNKTKRDQHTHEISQREDKDVNILSKSNFELLASKITSTYKIGKGNINFGTEWNRIKGNGFLINNEGYTKNNIYTNNEEKVAIFFSYETSYKNYRFNVGLRYEHTIEKSTEDSIQTEKYNRKYNMFYPSLSISKTINDIQLSLMFNRRVRRPSFTELNDNTFYVNKFVLQKGNPFLEKVDIFDFNLISKYKMFSLNLGYSHQDNPIAYSSELDNDYERIYLTLANYSRYEEITSVLNFNHNISFWNPNYTISVIKPYFTTTYLDEKIDYNKIDYSFIAYNDFILPNNFTFSLNFRYRSNYNYYLIKVRNYKRFDVGLRKSLFNKNLRLNLEMRDVFNWVKEKNTVKVNDILFNQQRERETQYVIFSISYQFNNYKKIYRGKNAAENDINRL